MTRAALTIGEKACLDFITEQLRTTGVCPSYAEIISRLGAKSKSYAHRLVQSLAQKGYITRSRGARSIALVDGAHPATCFCAPCAGKKIANGQRLVDALSVQAPRQLLGISLVGIRHLSPATAHAVLGASPASEPSTTPAAGGSFHSKVRP